MTLFKYTDDTPMVHRWYTDGTPHRRQINTIDRDPEASEALAKPELILEHLGFVQ